MGMSVGGKGAQADINVTPLVDIVLVLLIIFMVITPMLTKHMPILVPQKAETELPNDDKVSEQLVIELFADGHVELNKTAILPEDLEGTLASKLAGKDDAVVFFDAEDDAPYGMAVLLMDLAKTAGATTIGVMTPDEAAEGVPGAEGAPAEGAPAEGAPAEAPAPE